ncbi:MULTISPECIES: phage tail protein [Pseudomonas]|uniref:phage tail protein n=1 Tax=Pseudomonas TaxID=286 RepID=UPI002B40EDC1|nr:phage tail protein [Pseudomonas sichuanensis]
MSRADDLAELERGLLAVRGLNNTPITASKVLSSHETGVLLVDASAGAVTITLPPANRPMDVRVQRIDNSDNRLTVQAASDETVRFHTRLRAAGYAFFVLMGAGDFWHLRSDGAGAWLPLDRLDGTALGRPIFETTTALSPGGWGEPNGSLLNRAEWPWLWDHAQQSGLIVTEAQRGGMEGAWTRGDEAATFRVPDLRGEFLRGLDEGRGLDPERVAGSRQVGSLQILDSTVTTLSVTGLYNPSAPESGAPSRVGLDPVVAADYGAAASLVAVAASGAVSTATSQPNGFGVTRPRNIAYPVRIKLI